MLEKKLSYTFRKFWRKILFNKKFVKLRISDIFKIRELFVAIFNQNFIIFWYFKIFSWQVGRHSLDYCPRVLLSTNVYFWQTPTFPHWWPLNFLKPMFKYGPSSENRSVSFEFEERMVRFFLELSWVLTVLDRIIG